MHNDNIVLFSGYAKLPTGTAASEVYKVLAIVVLVDMQTGKIIDADCTLSTRLSERFLAKALIGSSIANGVDEQKKRINCIYQGSAKKAIMSALNVIYNKYREFVNTKQL